MEDCRLLRNELVLLLFVAELVLKNHAFDVVVVGMDKCNWRVARQVHLSNTTSTEWIVDAMPMPVFAPVPPSK